MILHITIIIFDMKVFIIINIFCNFLITKSFNESSELIFFFILLNEVFSISILNKYFCFLFEESMILFIKSEKTKLLFSNMHGFTS